MCVSADQEEPRSKAVRLAKVTCLAAWLVLGSAVGASATTLTVDGTWLVLNDCMTEGQYFSGPGTFYPTYPVTGNCGVADGRGAGSGNGTSDIDLARRYEWTSAVPVRLDITDWSIATDRYRIWVDAFDPAVPYADMMGGTEWQNIPGCELVVFDGSAYVSDGSGAGCHFNNDFSDPELLDKHLADPIFANGSFYFEAGSHALVLQAAELPHYGLVSNGAHAGLGGVYRDSTVAVRVSPVPEPATLLLVGSGLAASLLRRRHRARHPPAR